jgi:hypothetical protein
VMCLYMYMADTVPAKKDTNGVTFGRVTLHACLTSSTSDQWHMHGIGRGDA